MTLSPHRWYVLLVFECLWCTVCLPSTFWFGIYRAQWQKWQSLVLPVRLEVPMGWQPPMGGGGLESPRVGPFCCAPEAGPVGPVLGRPARLRAAPSRPVLTFLLFVVHGCGCDGRWGSWGRAECPPLPALLGNGCTLKCSFCLLPLCVLAAFPRLCLGTQGELGGGWAGFSQELGWTMVWPTQCRQSAELWGCWPSRVLRGLVRLYLSWRSGDVTEPCLALRLPSEAVSSMLCRPRRSRRLCLHSRTEQTQCT